MCLLYLFKNHRNFLAIPIFGNWTICVTLLWYLLYCTGMPIPALVCQGMPIYIKSLVDNFILSALQDVLFFSSILSFLISHSLIASSVLWIFFSLLSSLLFIFVFNTFIIVCPGMVSLYLSNLEVGNEHTENRNSSH